MQRLIVAVLAAGIAAVGAAVATARADVLDYGFDPGMTATVFGQTYDVTGDFGFDRTSDQITFTNADAHSSSGDLHLTSATAASPSEVVFDDGQNDRVDITFAQSLASATTDSLRSGTFSRGSTNYGPIGVAGSVSPASGGGGGGPEPSTWVLMMVGVFGAGAALRRRQGQRPSLRAA